MESARRARERADEQWRHSVGNGAPHLAGRQREPGPAGAGPSRPQAVDPRTHRVYVGNERGNTVSVVAGRRLRVQATVPVGRTPGGVAVAPLSGLV